MNHHHKLSLLKVVSMVNCLTLGKIWTGSDALQNCKYSSIPTSPSILYEQLTTL